MTTDHKATEYANGLRALADMIEDNPELAPTLGYALRHIAEPNLTREEMALLAQAGARAGGSVTKDYDDSWAHVSITFGPVKVRGYGARGEVCERVVVGKEKVTKKVKDPAALAAVPEVEIEVEEEVVEWRCRPLLADADEAEAGELVAV